MFSGLRQTSSSYSSYGPAYEFLLRRPHSPPCRLTARVLETPPCVKRLETLESDLSIADTIRPASSDEAMLEDVVRDLSHKLRLLRKKNVRWPMDCSNENELAHTTTKEYFSTVILSPIVVLFNQLRAAAEPLQPFCENSGEDGTFSRVISPTPATLLSTTHPASLVPWIAMYRFHPAFFDDSIGLISTPVILLMEQNSISGRLEATDSLTSLLHRAASSTLSKIVLITDLSTLIILRPLGPQPPASIGSKSTHVYEEIEAVEDDMSILRIAIASYLHVSLPEDQFIHVPERKDILDKVTPYGPHVCPDTPLRTDDEIFASCKRHSDFDLHTLTFRRNFALQFFRWKRHMWNTGSEARRVAVAVGDTVPAETNGFTNLFAGLKPYYPVDEIPAATLRHMEHIRRSSHPFDDHVSKLQSSQTFSLELIEELTDEEHTAGLCRTFRCRLQSIDGQTSEVSCPDLCVKLFDDRFTSMDDPESESWLRGLGPRYWLVTIPVAEEYVRTEDAVYRRLAAAQGALLPRYYGAHRFFLRDGLELFGILTEYVNAPSLREVAGKLTKEQQAQLTQSIRHAVRLLQCADVSQHDWHAGQILCVTPSSTSDTTDTFQPSPVHCVFIDFAAATFSVEELEFHREDDYGEVFRILTDTEDGLGMDTDVVWENYAERETWDTMSFLGFGDEKRQIKPIDPFEYVYKGRTRRDVRSAQ